MPERTGSIKKERALEEGLRARIIAEAPEGFPEETAERVANFRIEQFKRKFRFLRNVDKALFNQNPSFPYLLGLLLKQNLETTFPKRSRQRLAS